MAFYTAAWLAEMDHKALFEMILSRIDREHEIRRQRAAIRGIDPVKVAILNAELVSIKAQIVELQAERHTRGLDAEQLKAPKFAN